MAISAGTVQHHRLILPADGLFDSLFKIALLKWNVDGAWDAGALEARFAQRIDERQAFCRVFN